MRRCSGVGLVGSEGIEHEQLILPTRAQESFWRGAPTLTKFAALRMLSLLSFSRLAGEQMSTPARVIRGAEAEKLLARLLSSCQTIQNTRTHGARAWLAAGRTGVLLDDLERFLRTETLLEQRPSALDLGR